MMHAPAPPHRHPTLPLASTSTSGAYAKRRTSPRPDGAPPPAKRTCSVSPSRPPLRRASTDSRLVRSTDSDALVPIVRHSPPRADLPDAADAPPCAAVAPPPTFVVPLLPAPTDRLPSAPGAPPGLARSNIDSYRHLLELDYRDEVFEYMSDMEGRTLASVELIDAQPELQWYMRPYLVDFLIEVHLQHTLRPETLYLAMNIVDRYVSRRVVYKKHYQLVGCASLWIAAKFEDAKDRVPTVHDLCQACCGAYEESAFVQMEGHVLSTIGWVIGAPTAEAWLRFATVTPAGREDGPTTHVARFVMELTLFHRGFVAHRPSDVAAGALLLARHICQVGPDQASVVPDVRALPVLLAQMLDQNLAEHLDLVSPILIKKYAFGFYARASSLVREWYLSGRRIQLAQLAPVVSVEPAPSAVYVPRDALPVPTPTTPSSARHPSTTWDMSPSSSECSSSDSSAASSYCGDLDLTSEFDEPPLTPVTPMSELELCPSSGPALAVPSKAVSRRVTLPSARSPVVDSPGWDADAMQT